MESLKGRDAQSAIPRFQSQVNTSDQSSLEEKEQSIRFGYGSAGLATCRIHSFLIRCEQAVSMKETC
jgi:hypothetical protein